MTMDGNESHIGLRRELGRGRAQVSGALEGQWEGCPAGIHRAVGGLEERLEGLFLPQAPLGPYR